MSEQQTAQQAQPRGAHRRRVEAVFRGEWPDRIPICEQAFASSVAGRILGRDVLTGSTDVHFAEAVAWLDGDAAHEEFVAKLYEDCIALHRALDLDILYLPWRNSTRPTRRVDESRVLYGDPETDDWEIHRFDPVSRTYGVAESARRSRTYEQVAALIRKTLDTPLPAEEPLADPLRARAVREHGDEFEVAGGVGMAIPMQPGWLEATVLDPGLLAAHLDRVVEGGLASLEAQHRAGLRLMNGGGDFAFNSGPVYSPQFFEQVMAPRWKRLFDRCRELGMWYVMRSDGNLWPVADALFGRARPHAYYECDYDAGMHFEDLRAAFPELVLMGNVSCALLRRGTPEDVRRRTLECIEAAAPRVVAASANSILHGTAPENVLTLYETAKAWRRPV